jgi:hypothetical protein
MASQEKLRRAYPSKITPTIFGKHFNERPQPNAFGRADATPLEIQQVINREFHMLPQKSFHSLKEQGERVIPEYERLKQEREQRKAAIRARLR